MAQQESNIFKTICLEASRLGARLFRNNVGLFYTMHGTPIRCGLTKGSCDGIGWYPVTITPDMVGSTVAIFLAVETKTESGKLSSEQKNFIDQVNKSGGIALVARSVNDFILNPPV